MKPLFDQVVGTGGIGTGVLFELSDSRPLSRNETRLAKLTPTRDYCKQHIILHYIARVLAPGVAVRAIGLVGEDDQGAALLAEMRSAGIDAARVGRTAALRTMYCVCIQYPDKAVCNVTTSESACSLVTAEYVGRALDGLSMDGKTVAIAAPEVPVAARLELLRRARDAGALTVASCLVDEFAEFGGCGGLRLTDILAVNEDEAAAYLGEAIPDMEELARACHRKLRAENPSMRLLMTCGANGSCACEGERVAHVPALPGPVVATGGAGDAYIAGCAIGLILGLPFLPGSGVSAAELGAHLARESIGSADTIAFHIGRATALDFIEK